MIRRSHFSELTIDFCCCLRWFVYVDITKQKIFATEQFLCIIDLTILFY
jgi:hypothetical protein